MSYAVGDNKEAATFGSTYEQGVITRDNELAILDPNKLNVDKLNVDHLNSVHYFGTLGNPIASRFY